MTAPIGECVGKFGFGLDMGEKSVSVDLQKKMTHQKKLDDKMKYTVMHTSKTGAVYACLLSVNLVEQALMDRFLACLYSSHHSFSLSVCVSIVVHASNESNPFV